MYFLPACPPAGSTQLLLEFYHIALTPSKGDGDNRWQNRDMNSLAEIGSRAYCQRLREESGPCTILIDPNRCKNYSYERMSISKGKGSSRLSSQKNQSTASSIATRLINISTVRFSCSRSQPSLQSLTRQNVDVFWMTRDSSAKGVLHAKCIPVLNKNGSTEYTS
jgi:hypothetical protein